MRDGAVLYEQVPLRIVNDITITFVVLALVVALFVIGRIPVGIIAIGTALALYATGVITMEQALAGFGDPTVVFIAALLSSAKPSTPPVSPRGRARNYWRKSANPVSAS